MKTRQMLAAMLLGGLLASGARATIYTWTPLGAGTTAYSWTNTTCWVGGGYPKLAGDVVNLNNDITNATMINLKTNIALAVLNIGDGAATNSLGQNTNLYNTTVQNGTSENFGLTFDSGVTNVPAQINCSGSGWPTVAINLPMVLNSDLRVSIGGSDASNHPVLSLGGVMAMNGHTLTFTNGASGQLSQVALAAAADFSGNGTIVNNAFNVVDVTGSKVFAGTIVANSGKGQSNWGSFTLTAGGLTNAAEFIINGYLTNGNVQMGGSIHSGNNSAYANNPGQRWTTKRVTLNGGNLDDGGQTASNNSGNPTNTWQRGLEWVTDNVSNVVLNSGYCYLAIAVAGGTTGTLLNITTLDRNPGTSLYAFGPTATNKQLVFANAAAWSKGAGGATNTQTMSVIPWIAVYLNGGFAVPAGFGTYLSPGGAHPCFPDLALMRRKPARGSRVPRSIFGP